MKKHLLIFLAACGIAVMIYSSSSSQTVSTFEGLPLSPNSYWNGSAQPFGTSFANGNALYANYYDTAYGGYWKSGWAYSNIKDSTTAGFTNMYSARPASGFANSNIYAIGQQNAIIKLTGNAAGKVVYGLYVTNSTYAALSMRDGDAFARKFGDTTGTHSGLPQGSYPDWFKLSITGYYGGNPIGDTVHFYLADYRFSNNSQDYIVNDWQWIQLVTLGNVDSLIFFLTSSDTGMYGMNTPPFFCIDNFTTADSPASVEILNTQPLEIYPNPTADNVNIIVPQPSGNSNLQVFDISGNVIFNEDINAQKIYNFDLSNFANGMYLLKLKGTESNYSTRIIKNAN